MKLQKTHLILLMFLMLLLIVTLPVSAVSYAELPWDWIQTGSDGQNLFLGLGTRDPDLGDNLGLELGAMSSNGKYSPDIDLLYFFDPSDLYSFNLGIGVFANNSNGNTVYNATYSGGIWFHLDKALVGLGYHSQEGLLIRCGLRF